MSLVDPLDSRMPLEWARELGTLGLTVLPARHRGQSKHPPFPWRCYQFRRPEPWEIDLWFGSGEATDEELIAMLSCPRKGYCPTASEARRRARWLGFGQPTARKNLVILTGAQSGIVVVDIDSPAALAWAVEHLPPTLIKVATSEKAPGWRGQHWYYGHTGVRVGNRARICTGVGDLELDVRGDGGLVLAPGSVHASGAVYEVLEADHA